MDGVARQVETPQRPRSRATHERITTALVHLVTAGTPNPNAVEVANRADVSLRTIYHHFHDLDQMYAAALATQSSFAISNLTTIDSTDGIESRCLTISENRDSIHATIAPILRAYVADPARAELLNQHGEHLALLEAMQGQTRRAFGRDLRMLPDPLAALLGMETALSFAVWDYLRRVQGVNRAGTRQYMSALALSIVRSFGA